MKEEQKNLRVFEMTVLRKISQVTWKDRRTNVDILKELSIERDIISVTQCQQLTYFGHVTRMHKDKYCYTHGFRGKGRPKKRWIYNIREDCMDIGIPIHKASHIATDRNMWRNTVRKMGCQSVRTSSSSSRL